MVCSFSSIDELEAFLDIDDEFGTGRWDLYTQYADAAARNAAEVRRAERLFWESRLWSPTRALSPNRKVRPRESAIP